MIRTAALLAFALFWVPVSSAAASQPWGSSSWEWVGQRDDTRPIVIHLVRGTTHVVRRPGRVRITIAARSQSVDPNVVRFDLSEEQHRIAVTDLYPRRRYPMSYQECLPPENHRGDFWSNEVWLSVTVHAAQGVAVMVRSMDDPFSR